MVRFVSTTPAMTAAMKMNSATMAMTSVELEANRALSESDRP